MNMEELKERIENEIEKKAMKDGIMGNEVVSITLTLTDEEELEFRDIELGEQYKFDIDGNKLTVNYSEER